MVPELSVNSSRSGEGVQCGRRKKERPFHGVVNACHQARSNLKASVSSMVSWRPHTVELVSIILRRNVLPAGTTLAAKLRVPIRERSSCFLHRVRVDQQ